MNSFTDQGAYNWISLCTIKNLDRASDQWLLCSLPPSISWLCSWDLWDAVESLCGWEAQSVKIWPVPYPSSAFCFKLFYRLDFGSAVPLERIIPLPEKKVWRSLPVTRYPQRDGAMWMAVRWRVGVDGSSLESTDGGRGQAWGRRAP